MKNNKELTLMNEFNIAVAKSVKCQRYENIGDHKYYYPEEYGEEIKDFIKSLNVDSKEVSKESLRSTSSSARLCANLFFDSNVEFEKELHNDVSGAPTKMDAVDFNSFYECKCQEIVYGEHERFRASYHTKKSSKLFKEFNIKNISIKPHINKKGNHDYDYCDFDLRDMGIDYPGKYYDINFNVKQLVCHLIAIAHDYGNKEKKELVYLIFRPKKELIDESEELTKLYKDLDNQFAAITNSPNIKSFIHKYKIALRMEYIDIDKVDEHFDR